MDGRNLRCNTTDSCQSTSTTTSEIVKRGWSRRFTVLVALYKNQTFTLTFALTFIFTFTFYSMTVFCRVTADHK